MAGSRRALARPWLALGAALLAATGASAEAAQPASGETQAISLVDAAKLLFATGRLDEAQKVVAALRASRPADREVLFLEALLDEARGDYAGAIRDFRAILADEPANARVRLELGRAFFLAGDNENAERQFRLARAAKLPANVLQNVDRYLTAIRARRSWSLNVSVAIAPDSNINSATTARQVDIYGLPFTLSPDARATSGAGLAIDMAGEWTPKITARSRLRLGMVFRGLEFSHRAFDDNGVALYAGPQFVSGRWTASTVVTWSDQWYGDSRYDFGPGARLELTFTPTARLKLSAEVARENLTYRLNPGQSGPLTSVAVDAAYGMTSASLLHVSLGGGRQAARDPGYSQTYAAAAIGYLRELPRGFSIAVEPGVQIVAYDAPLAGFGLRRRDVVGRVNVSLLNRALSLRGFSPRITYSYADDASSIAVYSFRRNRIELRLTRVF